MADARCRGRRYRWARHCHQEAEPEAGNGDPRGRVPLPLAEHGLLPARPPRHRLPGKPQLASVAHRRHALQLARRVSPRSLSAPATRAVLRCSTVAGAFVPWGLCTCSSSCLRHPSPRSPHGWPVRVSVRVSPYWTLTQAAAPSPPTPSDPSGCLTAVSALGHRVTVCAPTSQECHVGRSTCLVPAVPLAAVGPHCGSAS